MIHLVDQQIKNYLPISKGSMEIYIISYFVKALSKGNELPSTMLFTSTKTDKC